MPKKITADKLPAGVCPTHTDRKLVATRTTGQMVCPDLECDYWRQRRPDDERATT